jgi:kynurenine formamidase
MSAARKAPEHTIYSGHPAHRDDFLDGFYLQGSSQIDGLRHRRSDEVGFYGGTADEDIRPGTSELGIQAWADHPIVSRGLLLDLAGYRDEQGNPINHADGEPLPLDLLEDVIRAQGTRPVPGDVLMIRTGWCEWFLGLDPDAKLRAKDAKKATGIAQSREFIEWAWDHRLALVAADNFAVECLPPVGTSPFLASAPNDRGMMHQELLAKLGIPLGELWRLGPLAAHMKATGHWDAMIVVKPLNIIGATGSPANATAIC